mmetsp:Transcript_42357/g.95841  ORF Transcript_42357/g.95841 Transcript_42357/m.95841 type:complete len:242 (-) Transcript_42357:2172-2897(-)
MLGLGGYVPEAEVVVRELRRPRDFRGPGEAQHQQVDHQSVVLKDEGRELQASDEAVRVDVHHVLEANRHVVFGRHVVGDVVVHNKTEEAVEEGQVHLLVHLAELRLEHHNALALLGFPNLLKVIHPLAPLVHEQWWRLRVGRLAPVGEQVALVRLVPEVLVEVGVGDLLQWFDGEDRDEVAVQVHELDGHLLKGPLRQEVALDAAQRLVWVVVRLFDKAELLALLLVQAISGAVVLFEALE